MDDREIMYVSKADGEVVGVIVPMAYWKEIEPTYQAMSVRKSGEAKVPTAGYTSLDIGETKSADGMQ